MAVPQGVRQGERDVSFGNADSMPQGHEGCRPVGDEAGESKSSGAGLQARRSDGDGAPGQARGPGLGGLGLGGGFGCRATPAWPSSGPTAQLPAGPSGRRGPATPSRMPAGYSWAGTLRRDRFKA